MKMHTLYSAISAFLISVFLLVPSISFASNNSLEEVFNNRLNKKTGFVFSQFFYDSSNDNFVLIVRQSSPNLKNNLWYPLKKGWLIQSPFSKSDIYYTNATDYEMAKGLIQKTKSQKFSMIQLFLNQAWAQQECSPSVATVSAIPQSTGMNVGNILNILSQCQDNALSGLKNSLSGTADNVKKLITDPLQFFDDLSNQMTNLVSFIKNIKTELVELQQTLSEVSATEAQEYTCMWLGSLGADALVGILTGGASAAILVKTSASLQRFTSILKSSLRLKRLGISGKFSDHNFMKRMNSCAL